MIAPLPGRRRKLPATGLSKEVDAYIANAPKEARAKLKEIRSTTDRPRRTPSRSISYKMPHYDYHGRLAWFASMKGYIGLYCARRSWQEASRARRIQTTKSAVQFPLDEKLPAPAHQEADKGEDSEEQGDIAAAMKERIDVVISAWRERGDPIRPLTDRDAGFLASCFPVVSGLALKHLAHLGRTPNFVEEPISPAAPFTNISLASHSHQVAPAHR